MLQKDGNEAILKLNPIGIIRSPYKEKFAVPRQPNLVPDVEGELHLFPPYGTPNSVRGLERFSHLWLIFLFHHTQHRGWHPTVRPPRLGGNTRIGTFATRSMFRPNPLGLSAVTLRNIHYDRSEVILKLGGLDLVDGTPIFDIKPYLPYSDCYPDALASYAASAPEPALSIMFSCEAQYQLHHHTKEYPQLTNVISHVLSQDPRPAYKKKHVDAKMYYIKLYDFSITWYISGNYIIVNSIEKTKDNNNSKI